MNSLFKYKPISEFFGWSWILLSVYNSVCSSVYNRFRYEYNFSEKNSEKDYQKQFTPGSLPSCNDTYRWFPCQIFSNVVFCLWSAYTLAILCWWSWGATWYLTSPVRYSCPPITIGHSRHSPLTAATAASSCSRIAGDVKSVPGSLKGSSALLTMPLLVERHSKNTHIDPFDLLLRQRELVNLY